MDLSTWFNPEIIYGKREIIANVIKEKMIAGAEPGRELPMLPDISFYADSDDVQIIENDIVEDQNGNNGNGNFDDQNGNGNENNNQEEFNNNNDFNAVDNNIQQPPLVIVSQEEEPIVTSTTNNNGNHSSPPPSQNEQLSEDLFAGLEDDEKVSDTVILDSE